MARVAPIAALSRPQTVGQTGVSEARMISICWRSFSCDQAGSLRTNATPLQALANSSYRNLVNRTPDHVSSDSMPRKRNIFDPNSAKPYKLSRSRLEVYLKCPRCFYLDRRLGIDRPSGPPFTINSAVDALMKREFDTYRERGEPHPYMVHARIPAIPAQHPMLDEWRQNFKGVQFHHRDTNFIVTGAIDDLWLGDDGRYLVADYKATAKNGEVSIDAPWQIAYKRQAEVYQWLLRRNGLEVSPTAWFVYCNGNLHADMFDERVEFAVKLLSYEGDDSWIDGALGSAHETLCRDEIPESDSRCEFCAYRKDATTAERW